MEEEKVSQYLLSNPDFLKTWLGKHGTSDMIEIIKRCRTESKPAEDHKGIGSERNSITSSMFKRYVEGNITKLKRASMMENTNLHKLNQSELFMELIRDIATELDVNVLCHKILQNVSILTKSDRGSLFLVRGSQHHKYLVSKLFDVTRTSTLEESVHTEDKEITVPFGRGIAGYVAETKDTVNIREAYEDPRFNQDVDKKTGYRTHSILCMPILSYDGEVIGVAQIINKVAGKHEFTSQDEEYFRRYLIFCGIGITNAQLFEMSVQEYKRNQLLLKLARGVFEEQTSLEKLVQKIMLQAQELLKCERCSTYLIEDVTNGPPKSVYSNRSTKLNAPGLFGKLLQKYPNQRHLLGAYQADPFVSDDEKKEEYKNPTSIKEVRFSKGFTLRVKDEGNIQVPSEKEIQLSMHAEIAKHVVVAGMPLNINDIEIEEKFGKPIVDEDGFKTKNILCMPIYNQDKKIIGVTQLINKTNNQPFNENDANIIEAFSIFTGLGIHNCQMYENACRLMAKQSVALEVLSYHATAQKEETDELVAHPVADAKAWQLYTYEFNDLPMEEIDTLRSVIAMFNEAGMIDKFRIPYDVMCRWTCSVKKNYRRVTYHNWRHAFNVTQTMFTMLFTGNLKPVFTDLDILAMLAGCLCHDLDHRGTNNAFQVKTVSPLAMLYSTSVMEHHHFDHCIMILNSEGNNIFQSLNPEEYRQVIKKLEHAILSTDLALYFKKRGAFKELIDAGDVKFDADEKKMLLAAMMMTACDVAAITKPWEVQREVAQLVANEFFEQGDIEKQELGEKPIAMMDREKKDELPKMQVGFIDAICIPVYKMFSELWGGLQPMYEGCVYNRTRWQELAEEQNVLEDSSASKDEMFAEMDKRLEPLYTGVLNNRTNWQHLADDHERKMKMMENASNNVPDAAPESTPVTKSGPQENTKNDIVTKRNKDAENTQAKERVKSNQLQNNGVSKKKITIKEPGKTKICVLM